jgi:hypothetical protein
MEQGDIVIIKASKTQLESVGIDLEITGMEAKIKSFYPDGYVVVEVKHDVCGFGFEFTNEFDIPNFWLEEKKI